MSTLLEHYRENVVPQMMQDLKYKNVFQVPRLTKIVLNMGVGIATREKGAVEQSVGHMTTIAGQKPIITKAKTSISGFKLREGMNVGCKTTLRGVMMYEFLGRLVNIAIPRIRDFRGLPDKLDGKGNYSIGIQEVTIFPEIDLDSVTRQQGMHITIVTTAKTDEEAKAMLRLMGMPFKRGDEK
jgi:large subunit ribosomal protein L5